jgi:membrane protein
MGSGQSDSVDMNVRAVASTRPVRLLKAAFTDWMEDKALRLSAALAYYSIFSIAPLLLIAISIAGLVFGAEAVRGQLQEQLTTYIGAEAASSVQSMVQSASGKGRGGVGAVVGFITLLFGASGVFGQLKDALNTIWEVKPKKGGGLMQFVRKRLLSFGMVLAIGFLLLTSLLLSAAVAATSHHLERIVQLPAFLWPLISSVISFCVVVTLFAFIFKVLPDAEVKWRHVWVGAVVTALCFEIGKLGLSYYLGRESTSSSYGAADSVILLLLWVYYSSCILFFGAEFTQVHAREMGEVITPSGHAERLPTARRLQQALVDCKEREEESVFPKDTAPAPDPASPRQRPIASHPLRTLLAVTGASFLAGILLRRKPENLPAHQLRDGLAGLTREAAGSMSDAYRRVRGDLEKWLGR